MRPIADQLATLSEAYFGRRLAEVAAQTLRDHRLYPNEVDPAVRVVHAMRTGARTLLVAHPMQSGKTNIMVATAHLLRALIPDLRAIYICAHDQLDFRQANRDAMAPHVELFSRSERRKLAVQPISRPTIVFYDESHFGDGSDMTISQFLDSHRLLDDPLAVFCGVSATPFSSLDCLEETVWADMGALEAAGYNSPATMLQRGRIERAEPMFETPSRRTLGRAIEVGDVRILYDNPTLAHLERLLTADERQGYCIIRCGSADGRALKAHLEATWGSRVYVEMWNQHSREFNPRTFFSQRRFGVITVVLVQHKARMGSVIATEDCHFMFECMKRSTVGTIAQSFIGRACGFGKQDHKGVIYSRPDVALAYSLLMNSPGNTERFSAFCERERLNPSFRACITHAAPVCKIATLEVFRASIYDSAANLRKRCEGLRQSYKLKTGAGNIRTVSRTADPAKSGFVDAQGRPRMASAEAACGPNPGDWAIIIFDRVVPPRGRRAKIEEKGIFLAIRGQEMRQGAACVQPTEDSFHWDLKPRRRAATQMAFGFGSGLVPSGVAAASR